MHWGKIIAVIIAIIIILVLLGRIVMIAAIKKNAVLTSPGGHQYMYLPAGSCQKTLSPNTYPAGDNHIVVVDECYKNPKCMGISQVAQTAPYKPVPIDEITNPWAGCSNVSVSGGHGAWALL